jgi:hypothetical protein
VVDIYANHNNLHVVLLQAIPTLGRLHPPPCLIAMSAGISLPVDIAHESDILGCVAVAERAL